MTRKDLPNILYQIIYELGGSAEMIDIFKSFWSKYKNVLKETDDIFYTWNYDMRWAATQLRKDNRMKPAKTKENTLGASESPKGIWEIII